MARINPDLLGRLLTRLNLSKSQVYMLIDAKVRTTHLPRPLAAIAVAGERGINISRFASAQDLAEMRRTAIGAAPAPVVVHPGVSPSTPRSRRGRRPRATHPEARRGNTVFVVHGRDMS